MYGTVFRILETSTFRHVVAAFWQFIYHLTMSLSFDTNDCGASALATMTPSAVPAYLRDSDFGASLNYDEDEEFSVPIGVTKQTPDVDSMEDLTHLLATVRFWGLRQLPADVIAFCFTQNNKEVIRECSIYANELQQVDVIVETLQAQTAADQMYVTMRSGYLDLVKYLHSKGKQLTEESVRLAIENGHAACLEFALQKSGSLTQVACNELMGSVCRAAIFYANKACIQTILSHCQQRTNNQPKINSYLFHRGVRAPAPYTICDVAACIGDSQYIESAGKRGWTFSAQTTTIAARHGQLDCLRYLHEHGCPWNDDAVSTAIHHKHLNCAAFMLEHGGRLYRSQWAALDSLIAAGELRLLNLLEPTQGFLDRTRLTPCTLAAQHGHLNCLIALRNMGFLWDHDVPTAAVEGGHYDCFWYAVQQGCPVGRKFCSLLADKGGEQLLLQFAHLDIASHMGKIAVVAATNGYMNCLTYAVEHGCKRITALCTSTAAAGQLDCLQYLHAEGFPWDRHTAYHAAHNGHYDCLEYVLHQGCPVDTHTCEHLAAKGELQMLQLAIAKYNHRATTSLSKCLSGKSCARIAEAAARHGQLACLQYLHEQLGFPVMDKVVSAAAVRKGQWECVRYLAQQGCASAREALHVLTNSTEAQDMKYEL